MTKATSGETLAVLEALHSDCFACGICNRSGLHLHFEVGADGVAHATWQPGCDFRSYPDRIHGGVIATLLDSSIVHALFSRGVAGVTVELTIRYLQSVNIHDPVHITGWVESARHGLYACRSEIEQAGITVVRAAAKFMDMPEISLPNPSHDG